MQFSTEVELLWCRGGKNVLEVGALPCPAPFAESKTFGRERYEAVAAVAGCMRGVDEPRRLELSDHPRDTRAAQPLEPGKRARRQRALSGDRGKEGGPRRRELVARVLPEPARGAPDGEPEDLGCAGPRVDRGVDSYLW